MMRRENLKITWGVLLVGLEKDWLTPIEAVKLANEHSSELYCIAYDYRLYTITILLDNTFLGIGIVTGVLFTLFIVTIVQLSVYVVWMKMKGKCLYNSMFIQYVTCTC